MNNYLDIFKEICAISRPSHHEEAMADYLCKFAERRGLSHSRSANNCVVIRKAASPGYEDCEPLVILNHMDMVCVAEAGYDTPGSVTPIEYEENGERWMRANHTSLGADNGIGLAMALAILDDDSLKHPALEVLTTTCEEDDMSGAANLPEDFIKGRRVLNLDSEAYDEITVGSAGAHIQVARLPYRRIAMPAGYVAYEVEVNWGRGGHSGVDINSGRANAIKILANLLLVAIRQMNIKLYLVSFEGGQAYSAIPGEAAAKVVIPREDIEVFENLVMQCHEAVMGQYSRTDPKIEVTCEPSVWHSSVINEEGTHILLACINGIPTGPVEMRSDVEAQENNASCVLTSNNIGLVKQGKESFTVSSHTRSFSNDRLNGLARNIEQIFTLTGAEVETVMHVGAWQEDVEHPLIKLTMDVFDEVLHFRPRPVEMHFALEAGYFTERFRGIHIASIGPRIINPHSTTEHVSLTTADNIWQVVKKLLAKA